jgi:xylan 1,4-beta-xylosidase
VCWYDERNHYYLALTHDAQAAICLRLYSVDRGICSELCAPVSVGDLHKVELRAVLTDTELQFFYATAQNDFTSIGPSCDASRLADEYPVTNSQYQGGFTGAFFGMAVHDMSGQRRHADFDYFDYED